MSSKDPYDILGVKRSASADEIKAAYRKLAKAHHPDRNAGDKRAEERFKEVQAAYEVLGDPHKRAEFDRFGAGGPRPDFSRWARHAPGAAAGVGFDINSFGDLSSIFEQFFSRGSRSSGSRRRTRRSSAEKGPNLQHEVYISFDEAVRGAQRQVMLMTDRGEERIEFRIPSGVEDGSRIRLRGKGQPGRSGRGDLIVTTRVGPHPYFRREGLNVLVDAPLSYREAALGAKVTVPTLDGSARVTIPPGASSGTKLRLRGKGVTHGRTGEVGDLIVVTTIVAPRHLSDRARRLLEELDAELGPTDHSAASGEAARGDA